MKNKTAIILTSNETGIVQKIVGTRILMPICKYIVALLSPVFWAMVKMNMVRSSCAYVMLML